MKEREVHSIGIVFFRRAQAIDCSKEPTSRQFEDFLAVLGWKGHHQTVKYFNFDTEIYCQITTVDKLEAQNKADERDSSSKEKKDKKKDKKEKEKEKERDEERDEIEVAITWAEDSADQPEFFASKLFGTSANIVIQPLPSGLYQVKVFTSAQLPRWGPLQDDVVVGKDTLPALVRETALNFSIGARVRDGSRRHPYLLRKAAVQELVTKFRTQNRLYEWWTTHFLE